MSEAEASSSSWNLIRKNAQKRWGKQSVVSHATKREDLEAKKEEIRQYPGTGPCGSKKKKYLVSKDEVLDWLEDDSTGIRGSWEKGNWKAEEQI